MRVSNLVLPDVREVLHADPAQLADVFEDFHPADLAEILTDMEDEDALVLMRLIPLDLLPEVFDYLEIERAVPLISSLPIETAATIAGHMAADERTDLLAQLSAAQRVALLARMPAEDSREVLRLLEYPPTSAGGIMTTEYLSYAANLTAADLLRRIREAAEQTESIYTVYLTDPTSGRLAGVASLRDLLVADPARAVRDFMVENVVTVAPDTDQEEVARLISKYDVLQVPVVDRRGIVLGIVTVDDVIDVLVQETTEDIQRIAAVTPTEAPYLTSSFLDMIRRRAGWLVVLFLSEMLTTTAMTYFEGEIQRAVVLALFVPLIISSGGNSGSQATSLIIRALAVREVDLRHWWRVFRRELVTGLSLGALLGTIAMIRVMTWPNHEKLYTEHYVMVGLTLACSLVGVVTFGTCVGSMLPFLMRRLGLDPATASAPFVATLVDVTGIIIYFGTATLILRGTLL